MKALLISRPGDFGALEDHWIDDPLFLPLPGGSVLDLHEASFLRLGVTEARILRCHAPGCIPNLSALENRLRGRTLKWSVRSWSTGPWPSGWTLNEALHRQTLFLGNEPCLVFWAVAADPRGWTGPQVPAGFPGVDSLRVQAKVWSTGSVLTAWEGPLVSLAGTREFFRSSIRFLETLPPSPLGLSGISRQAVLEPPLTIGTAVRAAARSHLGPLVHLAPGCVVDPGTWLSRTLVLTATRFSKDMAFADKIVIGDCVVEPMKGEVTPLSRL